MRQNEPAGPVCDVESTTSRCPVCVGWRVPQIGILRVGWRVPVCGVESATSGHPVCWVESATSGHPVCGVESTMSGLYVLLVLRVHQQKSVWHYRPLSKHLISMVM